MAVITLLTDFGNKDYYVSIFKGDLLTACPSANIVDVTHDIPPYDINAAAFFLKIYIDIIQKTRYILYVCTNKE